MLCVLCLSIFERKEYKGRHHVTVQDLKKAAQGGCKICISVMIDWEKLDEDEKQRNSQRGPEVFIHVSDVGEKPEWWYLESQQRASAHLATKPSLVLRDYFPQRPIPDNTGHLDVLRTGKLWVNNCCKNHICETLNGPRSRRWYPKRLLSVSELDKPPRLVERESVQQDAHYVALSHCWGTNPTFLTLTSGNLDDLRCGIVQELPQSFRDAIRICRFLEIPYLWIDSLCILQSGPGSEADWLLHGEEMAQIYLNCHLNLSFDAATNAEMGAFVDRNSDFLQQCYVFSNKFTESEEAQHYEWPSDSESSQISECSPKPSELDSDLGNFILDNGSDRSVAENEAIEAIEARKCVLFSTHDLHWSLQDHVLFSRGWALQERVLAPRILHFMKDRIAWECGTVRYLNEHAPVGAGRRPRLFDKYMEVPFNVLSRELMKGVDIRMPGKEWARQLRYYTIRNLTFPAKDKLTAVAAIAQKFSPFLGNAYLAGHFRAELPKSLLWYLNTGGGPFPRPSPRRMPTWSWASLDEGEILFTHYWASEDEVTDLALVESAGVNLLDNTSTFGPVTSGHIVLKGLVCRCSMVDRDYDPEHAELLVWIEQDDKTNGSSIKLMATVNMDDDQDLEWGVMYLVPIAHFRGQVSKGTNRERQTRLCGGLLLAKSQQVSENDANTYVRIGMYSTDLYGSWVSNEAIDSCQMILNFYSLHSDRQQPIKIV